MVRMRDFVSQRTKRGIERKSSELPTGHQLETTNLNYTEKWVHWNLEHTKSFLADISIPPVPFGSWTIFCIPVSWKVDPNNLEHNRSEAVREAHDTNQQIRGKSIFGGAELSTRGSRIFFQDIGQRAQGTQPHKSEWTVCVWLQHLAGGGGQEGAGKGQSTATRQPKP